MGAQNYFRGGDWNAICDICGGKFKASRLRKTWDGFYACQKDWYPRQPLDFPVKVRDDSAPPFSRPYGTDENINGTPLDLSGIIQFYDGYATSPEIPQILATSTVSITLQFADGPIGTYSTTIQPGVGFTVTSWDYTQGAVLGKGKLGFMALGGDGWLNVLENSTIAYTVTV